MKVRVRKKARTSPEEASGKRKIRGRTMGLNIRKTWVRVLEENRKNKWTDQKIQAFMRKEFPGRDASDFTSETGVSAVRAAYNRGVYTHGKVPERLSVAYDDSGNPLDDRRSSKRLRIRRGHRRSGKKALATKKAA